MTLILSKRDGAKGWTCDRRCPQRKVSKRRDRACAPQANWFLGTREQRLFSIGGNQQCERLQISISITRPRTPGIFLTRDSGITCCGDVSSHSSGTILFLNSVVVKAT